MLNDNYVLIGINDGKLPEQNTVANQIESYNLGREVRHLFAKYNQLRSTTNRKGIHQMTERLRMANSMAEDNIPYENVLSFAAERESDEREIVEYKGSMKNIYDNMKLYIKKLPETELPKSFPKILRMYKDMETDLRQRGVKLEERVRP